jgi:hypothetical protein
LAKAESKIKYFPIRQLKLTGFGKFNGFLTAEDNNNFCFLTLENEIKIAVGFSPRQ